MAEYAVPRFSRTKVDIAGKAIAKPLPYNDHAIEVYRIAHNWRDSHFVPLISVRREVSIRARMLQDHGVLTAARIKRMQSIRRKLAKDRALAQIQDIAGVRAIMKSMKEVHELIQFYQYGASRHAIKNQNPYIDRPKAGGYRSHHIIFGFSSKNESPLYNGMRVELQIRTRLQHAWATAVEAVGLVRNEDLKGGQGNADWLRLFELLSSEFAESERTTLIPTAADNKSRRRAEIREINARLNAVETLKNYNESIQYTETYSRGQSRFFLMQFDRLSKKLSVRPYTKFADIASAYVDEENNHSQRNTVLVETDKISDLRAAYPNYFLDVGHIVRRLSRIINMVNADAARSFSAL